ncbi:MAG: 6-phosphogluconolactonase, partial [Rhodospirillales bacterium]
MAQGGTAPRPAALAIIEFSPQALAGFLADGLREALKRGPFASLAVSGGRTPESVFPLLAQADLAWERVWITLTDERWLPPHLEGSNEGLARRLLLTDKAAKARFVGFWNDSPDPEAGLPALEVRLGQMPWPLDVLFLGMGADGHIASLFPNSLALEADSGRVAPALGPPPYPLRMTLTL